MKNTCGLHVHFSCQHNTAKVKDSLKKKKKKKKHGRREKGKGKERRKERRERRDKYIQISRPSF